MPIVTKLHLVQFRYTWCSFVTIGSLRTRKPCRTIIKSTKELKCYTKSKRANFKNAPDIGLKTMTKKSKKEHDWERKLTTEITLSHGNSRNSVDSPTMLVYSIPYSVLVVRYS